MKSRFLKTTLVRLRFKFSVAFRMPIFTSPIVVCEIDGMVPIFGYDKSVVSIVSFAGLVAIQKVHSIALRETKNDNGKWCRGNQII